jgi:hypothetical protein
MVHDKWCLGVQVPHPGGFDILIVMPPITSVIYQFLWNIDFFIIPRRDSARWLVCRS